jgi:hypothetical protein
MHLEHAPQGQTINLYLQLLRCLIDTVHCHIQPQKLESHE